MNYIGNIIEYSYSVGESYSVKFEEDSCTWLCTEGAWKGSTGKEQYSAVEVSDNVLFVSWLENNGEVVSLVINFNNMTIHCSYVDPDQNRHQWVGSVSHWGPICSSKCQ